MTTPAPPDALRTVWSRPGETVRWLLDHPAGRLWPFLVAGEILSFELAWDVATVGTRGSIVDAWSPALLVLKLLAWITAFAALAVGTTRAGRALGGTGSARSTLVALAWGGAPGAAALPFAVLAAVGRACGEHGLADGLLAFVGLLGAWALGLVVRAVAEAHRIPGLRAALAVAVGLLFAGASLVALAWIAGGLAPGVAR